jgi:hypothetical protein
MPKKPDAADTEATDDVDGKKKKPKPTAKKAAPKKPARETKKPAPKAKKPARKKKEDEAAADKQLRFEVEPEVEQAPGTEIRDYGARDADVEDAEVIAETPAEDLTQAVATTEIEPVGEEPAVELSPEEQELQALYGEDLKRPGLAHAEYQDRQTADEDRPMMPEINARDERKAQWQERRDCARRSAACAARRGAA